MRFKTKKAFARAYRDYPWPQDLADIVDNDHKSWEWMVEQAELAWDMKLAAMADDGAIPKHGRWWTPPAFVKNLKP